MKIERYCDQCSNRSTCTAPCIFIEKLLEVDNRKPIERNLFDFITIIFPDKYQLRECDFSVNDDGKPFQTTEQVFSDEAGSPFMRGDDPILKQTGIFIRHFFYKQDFETIARRYDISVNNAQSLYSHAEMRIERVIEALDRIEVAKNNGAALVKLPKSIRIFLLHTAIGLSNNEICRLFGMKHNLVNQYITTVRDKLAVGEVDLIQFTDEQKKAAVDRVEATRARQKVRHKEYYQKAKRTPLPARQ